MGGVFPNPPVDEGALPPPPPDPPGEGLSTVGPLEPPPPPVDVIDENIELDPLCPEAGLGPGAAGPPPPTVIGYA